MEATISKKKLDLTVGNPIKVIILFTLPLLLGNLFQQLYNVVDSIIVGNYISDEALAAVSSSGSLINFFIAFIQGISVGGGIVIARHFGAKDKEKLRLSIHTLVLFAIILGVFLTIIGYYLSPVMLRLMGTPEDVIPLSNVYFQTYFLGVIFTIMYNCGSSIFRAVGDSKTPLYYLIVASIVNIILDVIFVKYLNLGVRGVAIGTICSQAVSMCLTFGKLMIEKTDYQFKFKELKLDRTQLKLIIAYGVPTGIQNSIISLSNVFIQANINSFGKFAQAGSGSYAKVDGFATMPSGSFSMALSTYVSQNIGAKEYKRARKGAMQGLAIDIAITEFLSLIIFIFAPQLIGMFSDTPEVISYGVSQARICTPFAFLLAYAHGMSGILRGSGYSKTPMVILLTCWVAIRITCIPLALSIESLNRIQTIYWFYPLTWSLSMFALTFCAIKFPWAKEKDSIS